MCLGIRVSLLLWVFVCRVFVGRGVGGGQLRPSDGTWRGKKREVLGIHRSDLGSVSATPGGAQVEPARCRLPAPSETSLDQARCHYPLRTRPIGGTCVCCLRSFPAQAPTHPRPQLVQTRSRRATPLICPPPQHPPALPFLPSLSTAPCPRNVSRTPPRP